MGEKLNYDYKNWWNWENANEPQSIEDILKRDEKRGNLMRWAYKWEIWETIKCRAKNWEQRERDKKTERIITEMADKFSTLGISLKWEKNTQGKYEISLSRNNTWVSIEIPETESEGVKLSTEDFLNILYVGIESKGNAFKNQEIDFMTKWVRALVWNEEDYKKLPFSITLQNGQVISFWMGKYTTPADKKRGEALIKYGRELQNICKKLSS